MNEVNNSASVEYKGRIYNIVFNLNVMEALQNDYGALAKWGELTDQEEPDMKALIDGFTYMINEGVDIDNEDNEGVEGYEVKKPLTRKQVGRLISVMGMAAAAEKLGATVVDSTKSEEKN